MPGTRSPQPEAKANSDSSFKTFIDKYRILPNAGYRCSPNVYPPNHTESPGKRNSSTSLRKISWHVISNA